MKPHVLTSQYKYFGGDYFINYYFNSNFRNEKYAFSQYYAKWLLEQNINFPNEEGKERINVFLIYRSLGKNRSWE
jgi:hypothetical protein